MTIKLLSNSTINKISAGEVIERPSSVVKELVENAIDAGADKIEIILEAAGKNLICIKDNGKGMSKAELELAIQRHATSKLDENDLLNINSFGFRGEALPSIGAISKFKITSIKNGSDTGHSLTITGGKQEETVKASISIGTIIEVRDLFFATPARLKFLRTDRTELNASIAIVKKIALAHPKISFKLTHNQKELIKTRSQSDDSMESIRQRASELLGNDFIENSAEVNIKQGGTSIYGYTSIPTYNRTTAEDQFLFINNRPVKDKVLNIALKVAYQDYLARDRNAVCVLFIDIDPHDVDVNVHPAKSEVRFHDPNNIRNLVISSIKGALNASSDRVSTKASEIALDYMQKNAERKNMQQQFSSVASNSYSQGNLNLQEPGADTRFNTNNGDSLIANKLADEYLPREHRSSSNTVIPEPRIDYAASELLVETKPESKIHMSSADEDKLKKYPLGSAKAQLHQTYIVSQTEDSVIITDQHAAHERIGYEKIKQQIARDGLSKQRLLIPEIVELPDRNRAGAVNENKQKLSELGLSVEKFGDNTIIVSEVPAILGDVNINALLLDLANYLTDTGENIALTELIEHVTETYACHYAIRAGRILNPTEMNALLRQMEETPFSGQCNHGRQTYVELKLKDIEKLFGRK